MTPYYSIDGNNILYSASKELGSIENLGKWFEIKHPIYKINTESKQITQLTNSTKSFDFAPTYINFKDLIFLRIDFSNNISMWKIQNGNELKIIDGLIFYNNEYKVQDYYGHFYNSDYIDIK